MTWFRSILPALTLVLLLGFTTVMAKEMFHCANEPEASAPCSEQCCLQCSVFHNMDVSTKAVRLVSRWKQEIYSFYFFENSFFDSFYPSQIERPPI